MAKSKREFIFAKWREVCPRCGEPNVKPQAPSEKTCGTCAWVWQVNTLTGDAKRVTLA